MAKRVNNEDEKNERTIRGLLKLPANRRCINCNSLGPQYVCTNFWTFVCATCSGIHREFTHRVKSVSMAKFTSQEVNALQGGGNECAREVYFKELDPQSVPNSSNIVRLRSFIKHVYVDRIYTGERHLDKPPSVEMVDRTDFSTYRSGSQSQHYEDTFERRFIEIFGPGRRNDERNSRYNYDESRRPGYDQESPKYGDYRRSPICLEVVDDRIQDDRFRNRKSEDNRLSDGDPKQEGRSKNQQKALDLASPSVVHPVRDILGNNITAPRIGGPPKANGGNTSDGSTHMQRSASSSSRGSVDGNHVEHERTNLRSLIDLNADPELSPQTQKSSTFDESITKPISSSIDSNWATFDHPPPNKLSQAASNAKTMDSVPSQLPVPAAALVGNTTILSVSGGMLSADNNNMPILPRGGVSVVAPASYFSSSLPGSSTPTPALSAARLGAASSLPISSGDSLNKSHDAGQWPSMQKPQHSTFSNSTSQSTAQVSLSCLTLQSSQFIPKQTLPSEQNPSGRKELPKDLFTATYSSVPVPTLGWQAVQPCTMGYGMPYPSVVYVPAIGQPVKSTNPFDLNNESNHIQVPVLPSMASLRGALPNVSASTGLLHSSSLGSSSPQWMPSQSSPYVAMPSHPLSYALGMPPSAHMRQQINDLPPLGHQGIGAFVRNGAVFSTLNTWQQPGGEFSAPATAKSFSSIGGKPFG